MINPQVINMSAILKRGKGRKGILMKSVTHPKYKRSIILAAPPERINKKGKKLVLLRKNHK